MKTRKRNTGTLLAAVMIASHFAWLSVLPIAAKYGVPSPDDAAGDAEERYHVDQGTMQGYGETGNVSGNKKTVPSVQIFFTPTDPKEGEKITASAFPSYFNNPKEELYYTWYIKRKGCDPGSASGKPVGCDQDRDGQVTVEDWKIAAMRQIANGGYDINRTRTEAEIDNAETKDDDDYLAYVGGDRQYRPPDDSEFPDKTRPKAYCYIHDYTNGTDYELVDTSDDVAFLEGECPAGTIPACVQSDELLESPSLNPPSGVTAAPVADTNGTLDAGSYAYRVTAEKTGVSQSRGSSEVTCTIGNLSALVISSVTPVAGGTLAVSPPNISYTVTALDQWGGETTASAAASCTTTAGNQTCQVVWGAVTGASAYRLYRNDGQYFQTTATTYDDTGAAGTVASAPGANTSKNGNACRVAWNDVLRASTYFVYGRDAGNQSMYWPVTDTADATFSYTDTGAAGAESSGVPPNPIVYQQYDITEVCKNLRQDPLCAQNTDGQPMKCQTGTPACIDEDLHDESLVSSEALCENLSLTTPTCKLDTMEFNKEVDACQHLFPHAEGKVDFRGTTYDVNETTGGRDRDFNWEEEVFWQTDPEDGDTADRGVMDEAVVAGLGQLDFTWNYQKGDKVGVVVEGTSSIPTKHADPTLMVMWAAAKDACDLKEHAKKGSYVEEVSGYQVTFSTMALDLNDCLEANLVDPLEKVGEKLEVSLSYSPDSPFNDPSSDQMGDVVAVNAIISNAGVESQKIQYDWKVELNRGGDMSNNQWEDITSRLVKWGDARTTSGNNIPTFNFRLGLSSQDLQEAISEGVLIGGTDPPLTVYFPGGTGYVRVSVAVSDPHDVSRSREGKSDVILKVVSSDKKIRSYRVQYGGNPKAATEPGTGLHLFKGADVTLRNGATGKEGEVCYEELRNRSVCFVARNEIVGLEVDNPDGALTNFSWTVNGEPLKCTGSISSDCSDDRETNRTFLPITGNIGDTYNVTFSANDTAAPGGRNIELTRMFKIVDPYVEILTETPSGDQSQGRGSWPKIVGKYTTTEMDSAGNPIEFTDTSTNVLQTYEGNDVGLYLKFHPSWASLKSKAQFFRDGDAMETTSLVWGSERVFRMSFLVDKLVGGSYVISANAGYVPDEAAKLALKDLWNVSKFTADEKLMQSNVQLEVVKNAEIASAPSGVRKMLANVFSNVSGYVMFLLRVILTGAVIVLVTSVVFALIPESYEEQ